MSEVKHTPGPWCVSNGKLLRVSDAQAVPVVICGVHKIGSKGGDERGDPLANAHLIAAAPKLLELLERCADSLESEINDRFREEIRNQYPSITRRWKNDMKVVVEARAAIAKAKGDV